jgi:LCP family protein required for cell wall assembly
MSRKSRKGHPSGSRLLLGTFSAILILGGIYFGYFFYVTVRELVAHAELPVLSSVDFSLPIAGQQPEGKTNIGTGGEPLPDWQKKERVNILLLGIDEREGQYGPWRTDTMIVLTLDPESNTAGMLSIPRDLWVSIPGYGENRINTAHYTGDLKKYPGGGPALAIKTVQYNLGIPIHYYIRVNFSGFIKAIDTIGGIDIYVEKEIYDPTYPDNAYGYDPLYIPAGSYHMDGGLALKYARTRHGGSDFDRLRRQQQVIMAVRDKVLRLDLLPGLLPKLPELLQTVGDAVQTDLQFDEMHNLIQLAGQVDDQHIKTAVIDSSMTEPTTTPNGAQVLIPIPDKIRAVVDEVFSTPTEEVADQEETEEREKLAAEGAKIIVPPLAT